MRAYGLPVRRLYAFVIAVRTATYTFDMAQILKACPPSPPKDSHLTWGSLHRSASWRSSLSTFLRRRKLTGSHLQRATIISRLARSWTSSADRGNAIVMLEPRGMNSFPNTQLRVILTLSRQLYPSINDNSSYRNGLSLYPLTHQGPLILCDV
jgi:hypothetical protein